MSPDDPRARSLQPLTNESSKALSGSQSVSSCVSLQSSRRVNKVF